MSVFFPSTVGLDIEVENAEHIRFQILQVAEYFDRTEAFTEMAKEVAQADMETRFATETDPDGVPWLSLIRPDPNQQGILQLSGSMRDAAVSEEAWIATPVGPFFNTDALPVNEAGGGYWIFHEQPEGQGAQRISQRRFIGLDADAEANIERRADEWMAGGLNLGPRGFVRQVRSPLGRFAPIR